MFSLKRQRVERNRTTSYTDSCSKSDDDDDDNNKSTSKNRLFGQFFKNNDKHVFQFQRPETSFKSNFIRSKIYSKSLNSISKYLRYFKKRGSKENSISSTASSSATSSSSSSWDTASLIEATSSTATVAATTNLKSIETNNKLDKIDKCSYWKNMALKYDINPDYVYDKETFFKYRKLPEIPSNENTRINIESASSGDQSVNIDYIINAYDTNYMQLTNLTSSNSYNVDFTFRVNINYANETNGVISNQDEYINFTAKEFLERNFIKLLRNNSKFSETLSLNLQSIMNKLSDNDNKITINTVNVQNVQVQSPPPILNTTNDSTYSKIEIYDNKENLNVVSDANIANTTCEYVEPENLNYKSLVFHNYENIDELFKTKKFQHDSENLSHFYDNCLVFRNQEIRYLPECYKFTYLNSQDLYKHKYSLICKNTSLFYTSSVLKKVVSSSSSLSLTSSESVISAKSATETRHLPIQSESNIFKSNNYFYTTNNFYKSTKINIFNYLRSNLKQLSALRSKRSSKFKKPTNNIFKLRKCKSMDDSIENRLYLLSKQRSLQRNYILSRYNDSCKKLNNISKRETDTKSIFKFNHTTNNSINFVNSNNDTVTSDSSLYVVMTGKK